MDSESLTDLDTADSSERNNDEQDGGVAAALGLLETGAVVSPSPGFSRLVLGTLARRIRDLELRLADTERELGPRDEIVRRLAKIDEEERSREARERELQQLIRRSQGLLGDGSCS